MTAPTKRLQRSRMPDGQIIRDLDRLCSYGVLHSWSGRVRHTGKRVYTLTFPSGVTEGPWEVGKVYAFLVGAITAWERRGT